MAEWSANFLYTSFFLYLVATFLFGGSIKGKKGKEEKQQNKWAILGITMTIIGFVAQIGYFITRWLAAGHAPVSNLFEFTTFFGMMLVAAFIFIYFLYKLPALGLFALPIAIIMIAYASMFPREIAPLIPALQSDWLHIHVTTAALGQAVLAISFVASLLYLVKCVDQSHASKRTFWLEVVMYLFVCTLGFVVVTSTFTLTDYKATYTWIDKKGTTTELAYQMPAVIGPNEWVLVDKTDMKPLIEAPAIINAKKLNTVVWSLGIGLILYGLARLICRKRLAAAIQPAVKHVNLDLVDEISYRSVLLGFPIFTLGALIFAMIWAQIAWTRFWGWDPKEVWALVTWLFYAAFLHLRLSRGWQGEKSAWLAVIGFGIIIFNLIAVNLILKGLHAYA